ncbi:hypothetical protein VTL71DRAFT_2656 [Oculimacula yallundae]|uniref:Uncharacterized protein n=1 Tax=Oculimacula yallundae TaxID=86028 RepID=A0ABR4C9G8_9HELO
MKYYCVYPIFHNPEHRSRISHTMYIFALFRCPFRIKNRIALAFWRSRYLFAGISKGGDLSGSLDQTMIDHSIPNSFPSYAHFRVFPSLPFFLPEIALSENKIHQKGQ